MCFVDDQKRIVQVGKTPQARMEFRIGQHHARVCHHRFGQDRRDLATGKRGLDTGQVVEFNSHRALAQVAHLAQQTGTGDGLAVLQLDHRVVDRAMIATVEHQHLAPSCHRAGDTKGKAVGVRCRGGDLPEICAEGF